MTPYSHRNFTDYMKNEIRNLKSVQENYDLCFRFCNAMQQVEEHMEKKSLKFAFHKEYGYLLTCPSGIGTALRAGVHMRIPHLIEVNNFSFADTCQCLLYLCCIFCIILIIFQDSRSGLVFYLTYLMSYLSQFLYLINKALM